VSTFVTVPGQKFRHHHICRRCGHKWTHKAPTPLTPEMNDILHTCPNCAASRYEIDERCFVQDPGVFAVIVIGVLVLAYYY
jgi:hypothetical protein